VSLDDRTPELEAAIRAQDAVIAEAQRLLAGCRQPGGLTRDALIDELRKLFDGRQQRMRNGSRGKRLARSMPAPVAPGWARCPGGLRSLSPRRFGTVANVSSASPL
jgi:hypothetical protein